MGRKSQYILKQEYRKIVNSDLVNAYKDTGCFLCGYKKCHAALHLHHVEEKDPKIKGISQVLPFWAPKRLIAEIKKSVVLCSNCHAELHAGLHNIGDEYKETLNRFLENYLATHSVKDYQLIPQKTVKDHNLDIFLEMIRQAAPVCQKTIIHEYSFFVGISVQSAYRHIKFLRDAGKITVANRTVYI